MDELARQPDADRSAVFRRASDDHRFSPSIIEKDFWVCWTLRRLFDPVLVPGMVFKGGTSLSKGWNAIQRFSEHIDLTLSRSGLPELASFAPGGEQDLLLGDLSNNQRRKRLDALGQALSGWCAGAGRVEIARRIAAALGTTSGWSVAWDARVPETILFRYPETLQDDTKTLAPVVRLEFGAKMPTAPCERRTVRPCCVTAGNYTMADPATTVPMLDARRTFWEKATMLHEQNNRTIPQSRDAISRQYADVAVLWRGEIGKAALDDLDLLRTVAADKDLLHHAGHAKYAAAAAGDLHLVPPLSHRVHLRSDYQANREIYFDTPLTFEEIIGTLREIETEVRRRASQS